MAVEGWTMSRHAQRRRKGMRVTEARLSAVLAAPHFEFPDLDHDGRRRVFGDGLVIVIEPAARVIVTVMWQHFERWISRTEANTLYVGVR